MARSRNIKPGFFMNAELVELPPLVRLLFIGLWTMADREGRLEDRPAQIKMQVLPADELDTVQALCMLGAKKFLRQYEVGGCAYIEICKFKKHQNPHKAEQASVIPPPPLESQTPINYTKKLSTIPASCKHRTCLVLAGLIPDSLLLIPDLKPTTPRTKTEQAFEEVFGEKAMELIRIFPQHDFEVLKGACLAHYRSSPPPVDPYPVIYKWFQREYEKHHPKGHHHGKHERPTPKREDFTDDLTAEFLSHGKS